MPTDGGLQFFDKVVMFKFFTLGVHVNKYSMTMILSLKDVSNILVVTVTK